MSTPLQRAELACARRTFDFDYASCSDDELRQFFKAKLRRTARKTITRKGLMQQLQACDKGATFQFDLLPPELRVLVYEYCPFQREIPAVSKQAKKEALPILKKGRIVTKVTLDARSPSLSTVAGTPLTTATQFPTLGDRFLVPSVNIDDGHWRPMRQIAKHGVSISTLAEQLAELPKEIGEATHLKVTVNLTYKSKEAANHLIYLLATLLNGAKTTREVEIILSIPRGEDMSTPVQETLYATSRMGPHVFVKYRNFTKTAERALRTETRRSNLAPTLLFKALQLEKEIEAEKALLRQAGMAGFQHVTALSFLHAVQFKASGSVRDSYADREELIGSEVAFCQRDAFRELREKAVEILAERERVEAEAETEAEARRTAAK